MKVYHLKTCDTCRKAIKALSHHDPELQDVRAEPIAEAILSRWLETVGAEVLVNRKSATWRGLSDDDRAGDPLRLLSAHPTLMKRPVIEDGGAVHVGWSAATQAALGL